MADLTDAKRRLLVQLKRSGPATAPELATVFGLSDTAVRQHLEAMEEGGLVRRASSTPTGRGRPPSTWHLTELAEAVFPNAHGELTVGLLDAVRSALGGAALEQVIAVRAHAQTDAYRDALDLVGRPVSVRVRSLAALRSDEGYLADVIDNDDGSVLLVEHHCPIADAARACAGLCHAELDVFRSVLGDDVEIERTSHLLAGDARCAYLIRPRRSAARPPRSSTPTGLVGR